MFCPEKWYNFLIIPFGQTESGGTDLKRETTQITAEQIAVQMDYCMKIHAMNAQMDHTPLAMVDTYGCQQNEADSSPFIYK